MTKIQDLQERVEKLAEDERQRKHQLFARFWDSLTEDERRLVDEAFTAFDAAKASGQIKTETDAERWHASLPPDQRIALEKCLAWEL